MAPTRPKSLSFQFDPSESRKRVERALQSAGSAAVLVGFEAIGIQEFIAANNRPVAMKGASELVKQFDADNLEHRSTVFAGGGRGLAVVPENRLDEFVAELRQRYRQKTCGGQLAVASVQFDSTQEHESLRWLRMRLDGAKDSAPMPVAPVPASADKICQDCNIREHSVTYPGAEGDVLACRRCAAVVRAGRNSGAGLWTFEEISAGSRTNAPKSNDSHTNASKDNDRSGAIAIVCADGNNLGQLFANLTSLEDQAICSDLVSAVFSAAHKAACPKTKPFVSPAVGGDDLRMVVSPDDLLTYVTELAHHIHELADHCTRLDLPSKITKALPKLGVGIGAVIAPYHYPARRLLELAHDFEDEAKRACQDNRHRSAFDFIWLKSGEELSEGVHAVAGRPPAIPLGMGAVSDELGRAKAIRRVASSQRGMMVSARADLEHEEFMNLFCYQLARSKSWCEWFDDCAIDWRDKKAVAANLPNRRMLEIADLWGEP